MSIIDVSSSTKPVSVGVLQGLNTPNAVYAQGMYAYVANSGANSLNIVDISSSSRPMNIATTSGLNNPRSLFVQGRFAFLGDDTNFSIFDIGGAYLQQAEIGGLEAYTLEVQNNAIITNDLSVGGGLNVSRGLAVYGDSSFYATSTMFSGVVAIGSTTPVPGYSLVVNGLSAQVGGTTWTNLSDARTKNIKGDFTTGLSAIMSLNPKYFSYKEGFGAGGTETYTGFIAQDVAAIIPEAVSTSSDGFLRLNADPILWAMVNGIKEVNNSVTDIKSKIEDANSSTTVRVSIVNATTSDKQALLVRQENSAQDIASFETSNIQVMKISGQGTVAVVGTLSIDGRSLTCAGVCPAALTDNVDATMGDMGAEGKVVAAAFENYCPAGYAWVTGSAKYGTMPGFCIMQQEARVKEQTTGTPAKTILVAINNPDIAPANNINWYEAKTACQAIGSDYHLITEPEWLTVAENLANNRVNNLDTTGNTQIFSTGFSTSTATNTLPLIATATDIGVTYRTQKLANGSIVWDLAGNLAEWVDKYVSSDSEKPTPLNDSWMEYGEVKNFGTNKKIRPMTDTWSSANGIGKILSKSNINANAYVRGGSFADGSASGLWSLRLDTTPNTSVNTIGFRCTK